MGLLLFFSNYPPPITVAPPPTRLRGTHFCVSMVYVLWCLLANHGVVSLIHGLCNSPPILRAQNPLLGHTTLPWGATLPRTWFFRTRCPMGIKYLCSTVIHRCILHSGPPCMAENTLKGLHGNVELLVVLLQVNNLCQWGIFFFSWPKTSTFMQLSEFVLLWELHSNGELHDVFLLAHKLLQQALSLPWCTASLDGLFFICS